MISLNLELPPPPPIPRVDRNWDPQQLAVINEIANGFGDLIIDASAGSGKTTVIVEGAARQADQSGIKFLVFNVEAAAELAKRGVSGSTFHSLLVPCSPYPINTSKTFELLKAYRRDLLPRTARYIRLLGIGKNAGVGMDGTFPNEEHSWAVTMAHFGIVLDDGEIRTLMELLDLSNKHMSTLGADFDDILYMAARGDFRLPNFRLLFIDEAQDTNALQRAIIMRYRLSGTRIICVGDQGQALYGFRGAGTDSMNQLTAMLSAKRLPMTFTYRCPPVITAFARQFGKVESAPHLAGGSVHQGGKNWHPSQFPAGCFVVSRRNSTLTKVAVRLVLGGRIVNVRNFSKSAVARVLQSGDLKKWLTEERRKATLAEDYVRLEEAEDTAASVAELLEVGKALNLSAAQLCARFISTSPHAIQFYTVHGVKGLESDLVVWVNPDDKALPKIPRPWQRQQEVNAQYVAATRAKRKLVCIQV